MFTRFWSSFYTKVWNNFFWISGHGTHQGDFSTAWKKPEWLAALMDLLLVEYLLPVKLWFIIVAGDLVFSFQIGRNWEFCLNLSAMSIM